MSHKPRLFAIGEINTFFALMLDNMSDLVSMALTFGALEWGRSRQKA